MEIIKLIICMVLMLIGLFMFITAAIGVNKFKKPLNRIHSAALGDTLGILCMILGLIIWKGFSYVSLKLLLVILFFFLASPVAGHMISLRELETNEDLGEIEVIKNEDI